MFEYNITALPNGVTDVSIDIDADEYSHPGDSDEPEPNADAVTVTVSFAVMTDAEAWITIDGNGLISPAFGGTGRSRHEVDEYAEQAVAIWRAVTGNSETVCRYMGREKDDDSVVFTTASVVDA